MTIMAGIIASILALFGCGKNPSPATAKSDQFAVGQVWQYKTRDQESDSRVVVGRIEDLGKLGTVVHIKLVNLRIKNPTAPGGLSTDMSHAPITEAVFKASVTKLTQDKVGLDGFDEGYQTWLAAYRDGKGGVFTISVKEIVDCMEQAINKGTPNKAPEDTARKLADPQR
jgi:hypothetical protein